MSVYVTQQNAAQCSRALARALSAVLDFTDFLLAVHPRNRTPMGLHQSMLIFRWDVQRCSRKSQGQASFACEHDARSKRHWQPPVLAQTEVQAYDLINPATTTETAAHPVRYGYTYITARLRQDVV